MGNKFTPMDGATATAQVAAKVQAILDERGITQVQVTEATGIPRPTLQRRLLGASPFNVAELDALAAFLEIDPAVFIAKKAGAA
jgi:transcriptional regulator with XRE-family HTH domain